MINIYIAGLGPASDYGAAVHGTSNKELTAIQRMAGAALQPSPQERSLSILLLLNGVPTWRAWVEPIISWSREVWEACNNDPLYLSLTNLKQLWQRTLEKPPSKWSEV